MLMQPCSVRLRVVLLIGVAALPVLPPAAAAQNAALAAAIDSLTARALAAGELAGMTVAVVRSGDTLLLKTYGSSDLEQDRRTPSDAVYQVGSITKQFTAAAILQLMEQGKLSLDDEVTRFLPGYPTNGYHLTLRHLLSHTSGIRPYESTIDFARIFLLRLPRDSLVAAFSAAVYDFPPGERMQYSNAGYFLLGLVVERVSGMPYARYLQERLLKPAGMRRSRYCNNRLAPRYTRGYEPDTQGLRPTRPLDLTWPFSVGGLCATARDLVAWNSALHGGRILGPAAYREMITPGTLADGTPLRYAKGIVLDTILGHRVLAHIGSMPGFLTAVQYFPDDSVSVVVLMNTAGRVMPQTVAHAIDRVLFGPGPRQAGAPPDPAEYVGDYFSPGGQVYPISASITAVESALTITILDKGPYLLEYLGDDRFRLGSSRFTFLRHDGRITRLFADLSTLAVVLEKQ